jgi:hypothetical protein
MAIPAQFPKDIVGQSAASSASIHGLYVTLCFMRVLASKRLNRDCGVSRSLVVIFAIVLLKSI